MRASLAIVMLAAGLALAHPGHAAERMPHWEIVETVRSLAAEHLGRKKSDVNTVDSLFAQGMNEDAFSALMVAVQDEFGVVIPDHEIHQAKWNDPMAGLSVRRIAQMVEKRMQSPTPW